MQAIRQKAEDGNFAAKGHVPCDRNLEKMTDAMKQLIMLEDDLERIERFHSILARYHPNAVLKIFRNVPAFIAAFSTLDSTPDLICLDHDLFPIAPDEPDPGDGRDASAFLISQSIRCPVLIHSSNSMAADSMFVFDARGWLESESDITNRRRLDRSGLVSCGR